MERSNDCEITKTPKFKKIHLRDKGDPVLLKHFFDENGYVIVPDVISNEHVIAVRKRLEAFFKSGKELNTKEFFLDEALYEIPFTKKIIEYLKFMLGENIVLYPNFTVRKDLYTSWHIDRAFTGTDSLLQSNQFKHVQCALYLQENSRRFGGGLDVVPGSHRLLFDKIGNTNGLSNWFIELRNRSFDPITIDYKLGDLIIFHSRLIHRGTQMAPMENKVPEQQSKYGIFWSASKFDEPHVDRHKRYFKKTSLEMTHSNVDESTRVRFNTIVNFKYPENYPDKVKDLVSDRQIRIANL